MINECPYCAGVVDFLSKPIAIAQGYTHGPIYICKPCDAWVGCHENTKKPYGRLANNELRKWKSKAHKAFDSLWQSGKRTRNEAYTLLAENLGIKKTECHIGMFGITTCKKVVKFKEFSTWVKCSKCHGKECPYCFGENICGNCGNMLDIENELPCETCNYIGNYKFSNSHME